MKLLPVSILFIIINSSICSAQISVATRIGISTLKEMQIELSHPINETYSYYLGTAYAYRGYNLNGPGCGTLWPASIYDNNNTGFSIKAGITKLKTKKKKKKDREFEVNRTITLAYRRYSGFLRINSSGCSEFWNEYDFVAHDLGFYHYNDRAFTKWATFYWGIGLYRRFRTQTEHPISPSSETTKKSQPRLVIDLGWRIALH